MSYCSCVTALSYRSGGVLMCAFCDLPKPERDLPAIAFSVSVSALAAIATCNEIVQLATEILERQLPGAEEAS